MVGKRTLVRAVGVDRTPVENLQKRIVMRSGRDISLDGRNSRLFFGCAGVVVENVGFRVGRDTDFVQALRLQGTLFAAVLVVSGEIDVLAHVFEFLLALDQGGDDLELAQLLEVLALLGERDGEDLTLARGLHCGPSLSEWNMHWLAHFEAVPALLHEVHERDPVFVHPLVGG